MKLNVSPFVPAGFGLRKVLAGWVAAVLVTSCCGSVTAQIVDGYYHPLSQNLPPGQAAAWLNTVRGYDPSWIQPIRIELPTAGTVAVYSASPDPVGILSTPAQFGVAAGSLYRLRLAEMPEFPGVEIYPSVEILDHLHPPAGLENDFPIPVVFTADDLRLAIAGKLVTRVVYLEQPQKAQTQDPLRREIPIAVSPADNAVREADRLGRPMIIVRIGGRVPSEYGMPVSFYGNGGAVDLRSGHETAPEARAGMVRLSAPRGSAPEGSSGDVVAQNQSGTSK